MFGTTLRLFDAQKPYDSIISFTNQHSFLSTRHKAEFLKDAEKFLQWQAYTDQAVPPERRENFLCYDIPAMLTAAKQV